MQKTSRLSLRDGIIIGVCVVAVIAVAVTYALFANRHIFKESKEHLGEIYNQVNATFSQKVESSRNLLYSWNQYIDNSMEVISGDDAEASENRRDELTKFMEAQKSNWHFADFLLIDPSSEEMTADGHYTMRCKPLTGAVSVKATRRSVRELLKEDKGGVACSDVGENSEQFMLFAVPIDSENPDRKETYRDADGNEFSYSAIGLSYYAEDMRAALMIKAFEEENSPWYFALPDGTVLLGLDSYGKVGDNVWNYLQSGNIVRGKNMDEIQSDWHFDEQGKQRADTVLFKHGGDEYYVTYVPVEFGDWMLMSLVRSSVVNRSMNRFRTVTIGMMAAIFVLAAAAVAWILIMMSRRKVAEKELAIRSRENLFDLLTVNSNDLFVLFSPDTFRSEYVSKNVESVLGVDPEAIRADAHSVLSAAVDSHAPFTAEGLRALPIGKTWETDIEMQHTDGKKKYWYHMTLYHAEYNDKDSYIMMFSDRTVERRMSADLEDALSIAKSANAAKTNFLANMSHDIRTPMNAIIGYSTLLAKDAEKPDKVREYIRKITFSGRHLLSLINDILDMSKIESGKTTLQTEEFDFSEFLEEVYAIISSQAKSKNQDFELHTKGLLPEVVRGDKLRLNQVLLNLLSNAIKYTQEGGKIDLSVTSLDKKAHNHAHLRIEVKDNGIGMSPEFVKTVFDPFAREQTAATREIQGTGLGMTITKNIVDLMGGTISVQSEPSKGTTFTVELELAIGDKAVPDEDFWRHNEVARVLVVDDEEDVCLDIQELMCDTGVDIEYALSGKRAVEMVTEAKSKKTDYNIVLLDWKMPEMDGVETAKRIREKVGREMPIMVLTSYSFDEIEEEAKAAGIDYFMPKPFFVSNFRNAIIQIRDTGKKEDAPVEVAELSLQGLKVLAAEDNEINAEILTELMEIEGVSCDIARDGQEALDKFEKSAPDRYDMIFMDVQMPRMNGYEATRAIRACAHPQAKTVPIIAMTANAFDDDVRMALDSGMNAHLAKPIEIDKLKQLIAQLRERNGHAE